MELLSLTSVIGIALGWHRWRGGTAASAILFAVSTMLILLFLGALMGLLRPATLFLIATGIVVALVEGQRHVSQRITVAAPFGVFAILCVSYWLVHSGSSFFYYDEYSHWGVFLKDMLSSDKLWGVDTNSMHPRYLPGASLWQYFFAVNSNSPEGAAYLAQFVLLIAPLMILWERVGWRQLQWHLGILALIIIATFNFGHGFTSIYVDHILGTWFAGVLLNFTVDIRHRKVIGLLIFLLPLAVIVLLKSTGIFFALAVAGIMSVILLVHTDSESTGSSIMPRLRRAAILPISTAIVCASIMLVWDYNRSSIEPSANGTTTGGVISRLVAHESIFDESQQAELTRRYADVIFNQQISKDEISARYNAFSYRLMPQYQKKLRLTTASLLGLSLVALLCLMHFIIPAANRQAWAIAAGGTWLTALAYIAILYLGYRYVSADNNGFELSSYVRYAHSILLPVVLFCFASLTPAFAGEDEPQAKLTEGLSVDRNYLVFFLALVALFIFERPYLKPLYTAQQPPEFRIQLDSLTDRLRAKTGAARLWVFYPDNSSNGLAGQILQYQLSPGRVHVEHDPSILLSDHVALKAELRNWEYFWYVAGNPELNAAFERLIGETPTERVFRIDKSDGGVRFVPVSGVFDSNEI